MDIKKKLFDSLYLPMYGMILWLNKKKAAGALKQMATAYFFALKKLHGYPKNFSNHIVCAQCGYLAFKHFMNNRFLKLYKSFLKS